LPTIGFIGLGIMGRPMSKHLLKAGYSLVVYDIMQPAVEELKAAGAVAVSSPKEVAARSQATAIAYLAGRGLGYQSFFSSNTLYVKTGDLAAVENLAALDEVTIIRAPRTYYVDPVEVKNPALDFTWVGELVASQIKPTVLAPTSLAPDATVDWGITDTNAQDFWSTFGFKGDGIVVANIDTGVQWDHPGLVDAYKCPGDPGSNECWEDPGNYCGGMPCDYWPGVWHGTHTMGTMVAKDDDALPYIAGMAPNAQWISCLGCPQGGCPDFELNTCADWILAPDGDPANRPNVVNNSWGGGGGNPFYLSQVQAWVAAGVFPAFSAGNSYSCNSLGSPGDYQESFGSASHTVSRVISDFSSKGPSAFGDDPYTKPNLSAPGSDIWSTIGGSSWGPMSGTSMASPHTAGAVALLWSCNPSLVGQIDQTFQILQDFADVPPDGTCGEPADGKATTYGYGYLNPMRQVYWNCGATGTCRVP
jgi:subtilisin family serine protease